MTKKGQRLNVWVSEDDHKALKILAVKKDKFMKDLINEFIKDGLNKYNNNQK